MTRKAIVRRMLQPRQPARIGGVGAILLWLIGIPLPIILLIYFLGC